MNNDDLETAANNCRDFGPAAPLTVALQRIGDALEAISQTLISIDRRDSEYRR